MVKLSLRVIYTGEISWVGRRGPYNNSIIRNAVVTPFHKAVLYEQRVRVAVRGS